MKKVKREREDEQPWRGPSGNCFVVTRISSKPQQDGRGLESQRDLLGDYVERQNLLPLRSFPLTETAFRSDQRPEFQKVLAAAREMRVQHLVFLKVDRAVRNSWDWAALSKHTREGRWVLHFPEEGLVLWRDAADVDWMRASMSATLAEFMAASISSGTKRGQQQAVEEGYFPKKPCLGYVFVHAEDSRGRRARRGGTIEIEPLGAALVLRFVDERLQGLSFRAIADRANGDGTYVAVTGVKRKLTASDIHSILRNDFYQGKIRWKGKLYEGKHTPLITEETWSRLHANRRVGGGRGRDLRLFDGLLRCAVCGRQFTYDPKKGQYHYWKCASHRKHPEQRATAKEDQLLGSLAERLGALTVDEQAIKAAVERLVTRRRGHNVSHAKRRANLEREIERHTERLEHLSRLSETQGAFDVDHEIEAVERKLADARTHLGAIGMTTPSSSLNMERARALIASLPTVWTRWSAAQQRRVVSLITDALVTDGRDVTFTPLAPFRLAKPPA